MGKWNKYKYDPDIDGEAWDLGWQEAIEGDEKRQRADFDDPDDWEMYLDGWKMAKGGCCD